MGGGSPPPHLQTPLSRVLGFLKTSLHGVKKAGGVGGGGAGPPPHLQTPHLQTDCLYDDLKTRYNNYVFDAILVDGAIFLKSQPAWC